jgi:hypothetical protein
VPEGSSEAYKGAYKYSPFYSRFKEIKGEW